MEHEEKMLKRREYYENKNHLLEIINMVAEI